MLHLKRLLWLAAWSVWLWLGFGLYRELPRDLGPVVCKLQLTGGQSLVGFDDRREEVIAKKRNYSEARDEYAALDVHTGKPTREVDKPSRGWLQQRRNSLLDLDQSLNRDWWNIYLPERWRTTAIRNLNSFQVVAREWELEARLIAHELPGRSLVITDRNVVRQSPIVNWPRLVFCQTLLALPLILRWYLPQWRRRRKMAMAGATNGAQVERQR